MEGQKKSIQFEQVRKSSQRNLGFREERSSWGLGWGSALGRGEACRKASRWLLSCSPHSHKIGPFSKYSTLAEWSHGYMFGGSRKTPGRSSMWHQEMCCSLGHCVKELELGHVVGIGHPLKDFLFYLFIFNWNVIALWYVYFYSTLKWISYMYIYLPSLLSLAPTLPISPLQVIIEHGAELPVLQSSFPLAKGFKSRLELWKFTGEAIWRKSTYEMGGSGYWEVTATG